VLRLDDGRTRHLGPDLLADDTSVGQVVARLRATEPTRPLGDVLLDQRVVAGVGNMWMAELLWHAGLSPWLRIGDASDEELECAVGWGREAMRAAVSGQRPVRAVYRRAARPCCRCGSPIRSRGLGESNRTAYWCERCQRGR
jgi:endonuclease-8